MPWRVFLSPSLFLSTENLDFCSFLFLVLLSLVVIFVLDVILVLSFVSGVVFVLVIGLMYPLFASRSSGLCGSMPTFMSNNVGYFHSGAHIGAASWDSGLSGALSPVCHHIRIRLR